MMQDGYRFCEEGKEDEGRLSWLNVWEHLKKRFTPDMKFITGDENVDLLGNEKNLPDTSCAATVAAENVVETEREVLILLETGLDRVLRALGLEIGTIWLHPHRVARGLFLGQFYSPIRAKP